MDNRNARGSEWRKWDLHVHTPFTKLNNGYIAESEAQQWDLFCKKLEDSDVFAFGITDYFSAENYFKFLENFERNFPDSHKAFLPNIEFRIDSKNKDGEHIQIHVLFSNESNVLDKFDGFFTRLKLVSTDDDNLTNKYCTKDDLEEITYEKAMVKIDNLKKQLEADFLSDDYLIVGLATGYGSIRPGSRDGRGAEYAKEIDKICDAFFGNPSNVDFYLNKVSGRKQYNLPPKPVISGCDSHSFDDLENWLGKWVVNDVNKKYITWIKSDLTFEGLKQIIYEPESGERVKIGPVDPDQKDAYKVISKIQFYNTSDFPEEIKLNRNLCSIIGSRSSGKSALLAYVAHSVDAGLTKEMIKGPGEGDEYHWDKIEKSKLEYSIEWSNGQLNEKNPGKIVYIPQNYLFTRSKDPDEIKEKIKPVLFKVLPDFKAKYIQAENNIEILNKKIEEQVDGWFDLSGDTTSIDEQLKDLGNKEAIKKEKEEIEIKIKNLKDKYKLSNEELEQYQKASADISGLESNIEKITTELRKLSDVSEVNEYFNGIEIKLSPALASLPKGLQEEILEGLKKTESGILEEVNKQVVEYKKSIEKEKTDAEERKKQIRKDNKEVMEKYQGNVELEGLVNKINEYDDVLKNIENIETEKKNIQDRSDSCVKAIKSNLDRRKSIIEELVTNIESADQGILEDIEFGVEFGIENRRKEITQAINTKSNTKFVHQGQLKLEDIRKKPGEFLSAVYSEQQKVIAGNDKKKVASDTLSLTEEILFTAEMEEDKIGGFSEPTMTAGKRALFALKLILAESEDTWPLLIDQPEDDLDSRSIYDDVVPFLKKKKKERQIIMVSHNANLVIGADSEQVIVANRHGTDRENVDAKQFNYLTGSLEFSKIRDKDCKDTLLSQGIREHSCEILDGGKTAFELRKNKYNI
jgi:hypothetical protein